MMYWRNTFAAKLLTVSAALLIILILEVQIRRLQTQVRLLSKALDHNIDDSASEDFEELVKEKRLLDSDFENPAEDSDLLQYKSMEKSEYGLNQAVNQFDFKREKEQTLSSDAKTIVFYNRVPKTGSTSFMGVVYALCTKNNFHVIHLNVSKNYHVMGLADQMRFARNVTTWMSKMPSFYHGHQSYVDFGKLGFQKRPLYINIVRKPLERLVSYYYFLRFGDDFRPGLRRARQGNLETFDQCVARGHRDCQLDRLWIQIPFFCGQHPECWKPGNEWALKKAKENLISNYLVVGVTERLTEFVAVMEAVLPRYFKGATKRFIVGGRSHLRKTQAKKQLKPETLEHIKTTKVWQMENEFYLFANDTFTDLLKRTFVKSRGRFVVAKKKFFFEKIRPRPKDSL